MLRAPAGVRGHGDQLVPGVDAELGIDAHQMGLDGADRQVQLASDIGVGGAGGGQAGDALLLGGQRAGWGAALAPAPGDLELGAGQPGQPAGAAARATSAARASTGRAAPVRPDRRRNAP